MKNLMRSLALVLAALLSAPLGAAEFRQISQIIDSSGNPVVNGYIYIGTFGLDPVTNPISLFSDSALSVPIANPVRTDSFGRPTTDVFFAQSQYSYQLKTVALVSIEGPKNRDAVPTAASVASNQAGTATSCGTFGGTVNALTCTLSPAITAYTDLMSVRGRISGDNNAAVTLSINGVGAKNVVKQDGTALVAGDLQQNDTATFVFDTTNNRFQVHSAGNVALMREGNNAPARADIASAGTLNLDATATNYLRVTGTTTTTAMTLTDGRVRDLVADAAWPITAGASLIFPGVTSGTTFTLAAGDTLRVRGESGGVVRVQTFTRALGGRDGLCATTIASAASQADLVFPAGFAFYEALFAASVATDGATLQLRISQDGGSSFKSGANEYEYDRIEITGGVATASTSAGNTRIEISSLVGSAAAEGVDGIIWIPNPSSATRHKLIKFWTSNYDNQATSVIRDMRGTGAYNADANAINAIRFTPSGGTISGTFKLYCRQ